MIQNYDSEIEKRGHPETFLPDGILDDDIADFQHNQEENDKQD
jgi:hypothetical protein